MLTSALQGVRLGYLVLPAYNLYRRLKVQVDALPPSDRVMKTCSARRMEFNPLFACLLLVSATVCRVSEILAASGGSPRTRHTGLQCRPTDIWAVPALQEAARDEGDFVDP